jgi:hypothetical protein
MHPPFGSLELVMFDWLQRIFRRSEDEDRLGFYETIDALNARAGGGKPVATQRFLGNLPLHSGTLTLADPQYLQSLALDVPNIAAGEVAISADLWQYPSGTATVTALSLSFGDALAANSHRRIGQVGIDSATLVVADKADIEQHWTEVGPDRIGVISTARDDTLLRLLTKRFDFETIQVNEARAEIVGPISEAREKEVEDILKSIPRYADYPFIYFHVQTNNSFDRANYLNKAWDFIPVGNAPAPRMFVCGTGRGDGAYNVRGEFSGDVPCRLTIDFLEEDEP